MFSADIGAKNTGFGSASEPMEMVFVVMTDPTKFGSVMLSRYTD